VCHQTVSLIARHLEANGVPTVIMGCAKDLVEYCGAPRFLFSDFPLGNAAGKPNNPDSQAFTLELAMKVLETAPGPRTTVQSPLRWNADGRWKLDFSNIDQETPEELAARKKAFDEVKEVAKKRREQDGLKVHAAE
jgi:D-proline reductase (dithiol) PrdB